MAVAAGVSARGAILRWVTLYDGPRGGVVEFGSASLDAGVTLTPHEKFMHEPLDELASRVTETMSALTAAVEERLHPVFEDLLAAHEVAVVAVVIPRCPRVEDLRNRVRRRSYARCADEHLLAEVVRGVVTKAALPVVALSAVEALRRAEEYFGLDRQALGIEARRAQPDLGQDFDYHHRLPALAARVALAATASPGC